MRRKIIRGALLAVVLGVFGCAALQLQSPSVTISSLRVVEAGLLEQRFLFKLRVQNPNNHDIFVKGTNFEVAINDQPFVKGVSDKSFTLARLSETVVDVAAVSDLSGILRQIMVLREQGTKTASYRIRGRLFTDLPVALHFENSGTFDLSIFSGK